MALSQGKGKRRWFDVMDGSFESVAAESGVMVGGKETVLGVLLSRRVFWIIFFGVGRACNRLVVKRVE